VASNVDEKVQDFLVKELVKCENSNLLTPIGGVGRGEVSTVVEKICSQLIPSDDSEICHLMTGTVYLYLFTSGPSNGEEVVLSNQEGLDQVEQKLRIAFNGQQRRSLQASFVDKTRGILGLYYIGGHLEEESTGDGDITGIVAGSKDSTSSSVIPSAVVPAVLAVCVASLVAVFIVYRRRRRKLYDSSRDRLLEKDDSTLGEERWEEVKATPDPIRVKVIETTDESESSGSSGAAAAAAHEVVMEDLAGMTVLESLSDISFIKPVFIDPDSVTLYTYSPRIRYQQRDYFFADTIDI
jgi:cbb3-type cytochrome oxidase subunit 3